jgi:hypothetical protein
MSGSSSLPRHATELLQTFNQAATPFCQAAQVSSSGFEDHQCLWAAGRKTDDRSDSGVHLSDLAGAKRRVHPTRPFIPETKYGGQSRRTIRQGATYLTGSLFTKPKEFFDLMKPIPDHVTVRWSWVMPMNDFVRFGFAFDRAPIDGGSVRRCGR